MSGMCGRTATSTYPAAVSASVISGTVCGWVVAEIARLAKNQSAALRGPRETAR